MRSMYDEHAAMLAHDLKSPLSAITMNLEFAIAELPTSPTCDGVREALADCRAAGQKLNRMIANLVDVARAQSGRLQSRKAEHDACEIVAGVVAQCVGDAEARAVDLSFEAPSATIVADAELVGRAIVALVEPVLRAARSADRVRVVGEARDDGFDVRVTTDAALAPELDDPLAWQFAVAVADAHGGSVTMDDNGVVLSLRRGRNS